MNIVELYRDAGFSLTEIQDLTGVPRSTVRGRLVRAGVELRSPGGNRSEPPHEEYARTAFLYERMEMTTTEVSEQLGITHDAVCNRLERHGVTMRSRGESARLRFARRPKTSS